MTHMIQIGLTLIMHQSMVDLVVRVVMMEDVVVDVEVVGVDVVVAGDVEDILTGVDLAVGEMEVTGEGKIGIACKYMKLYK